MYVRVRLTRTDLFLSMLVLSSTSTLVLKEKGNMNLRVANIF